MGLIEISLPQCWAVTLLVSGVNANPNSFAFTFFLQLDVVGTCYNMVLFSVSGGAQTPHWKRHRHYCFSRLGREIVFVQSSNY